MILANPIWLWGLLALLVPLVIHLLSKKQTRILPFGSIRFLKESASSQSRSIELSDILMLILRLFLLIIVIIWLAGWVSSEKLEKKNWLILGHGIDLPSAYQNAVDQQLLEVKDVVALKGEKTYLNEWFFLRELGQRYPQIDSLIWIDNFSSTDFWGRVPSLSYTYNLIDFGNKNNQKPLIEIDTLFYEVKGLPEAGKDLIDKVLLSISQYSGSEIIYSDNSTRVTDILFSNAPSSDIPIQFIFNLSENNTYRLEDQWPARIIHLSENYVDDALLHDELLVIITEFLAQYSNPLWAYNSFEEATAEPQELRSKVLRQSNEIKSHEWLFWMILATLLIERVWAYKRINA
ncbi:hypothetical protein GCM10011506_43240 [Marivirga lumbricoides]|uniref:Aerotolerance regulator N-terminal domain-containing protein n=1 Tax=Marivirga lumbricoides TaxID=1046115 RepID=A0ABQ1N3C6_9BACT|nr:hypothetical protein GCM10011506_43240 [Marivirga lumbricoides]